MEVKPGRWQQWRHIRLTGPRLWIVTLKRGMTASFDLWDWFSAIQEPGNAKLRATAKVVLFAPSGPPTERCHFLLDRCVPTKLKAPALNAKDGMVAIEEFQLAYESLRLVKPQKPGT